jgi:hypothetical protein
MSIGLLKAIALFLLKKRISSFEEDRPPRKPLRLKSPIPYPVYIHYSS